MVTTIGIDPHKATHTAVAIDESETVLGELTVPADRYQTTRLLDWVGRLNGNGRIWAVEAAGGLGYLLSQQLVAHEEEVVDVPPVLAARVRVLSSGKSDKNDPNDARSVAIAALRQPGLARVLREDHVQVLRILAKRHLELTALRTQAVCRLHSVLVQLRPDGIPARVSPNRASQLLRNMRTLIGGGGARGFLGRNPEAIWFSGYDDRVLFDEAGLFDDVGVGRCAVLGVRRAGGGGKGMRRVDSADQLAAAYRAARSEALASFADVQGEAGRVRQVMMQLTTQNSAPSRMPAV